MYVHRYTWGRRKLSGTEKKMSKQQQMLFLPPFVRNNKKSFLHLFCHISAKVSDPVQRSYSENVLL